MIRYMTAGESHGEALLAIIDGLPAGLKIDRLRINKELKRRMTGYGRGGRMKIEKDKAKILSGLRKEVTIGSPLAILIENKDFSINSLKAITKARPGHADLSGALKYNVKDIRSILERASARETATRVAVGALAKILLSEFNVDVLSHVVSIGPVEADTEGLSSKRIRQAAEKSPLRCADKFAETLMKKEIDDAKRQGDTVGGVCEVIITGVPVGLGSYVQWDKRLDANLARGLMAIPAIKGVSVGEGFDLAVIRGSRAHDEIIRDKKSAFRRKTNNAGGIEGGISNGEDIVVKVAMKPIATLRKPLESIDIKTKKSAKAQVERADVCAVPACGVIAEAVATIEIANAMIEKFGGDSLGEMKRNFNGYIKQVKEF